MLRKVLQESPLIPRPIRHTLQKSQAISHISSPEPGPHMPSSAPSNPTPVKTSYTCNTVDIPPSFLLERADDSQAITATRVDFDKEGFPEYAGRYAVLLENVLSPSECKHLLKLAEDSAIADDRGRLWRPAMLNIGGNFEVAAPDTRNNDRIIWDSQQMIDRIWDRCLQAQGLKEDLLVIDSNPLVLGEAAAARGDRWRFTRPNERMRFLRYRDGQFFDRESSPVASPVSISYAPSTRYVVCLRLPRSRLSFSKTQHS